MSKSTKGTAALLAETPVIEVGDQKYEMRRLGLKDIVAWVKMIRESGSRGVKGVLEVVGDVGLSEQQVGVAALVYGLVDLVDDVTGWLADVLQVTPEELNDPNLFPLDALVDIVDALAEHPDLDAFLTKLRAITADPERLQKITRLFGNERSTESKPATRGATTNSS